MGIDVVGGERLPSLEERETADETQLHASGTAARMKSTPDRSPSIEQALVVLTSGVFKW